MNFFSNVRTHNFKNLYSDFETEGKTIRIHMCIYKILWKNTAARNGLPGILFISLNYISCGADYENSYFSADLVISHILKKITIHY